MRRLARAKKAKRGRPAPRQRGGADYWREVSRLQDAVAVLDRIDETQREAEAGMEAAENEEERILYADMRSACIGIRCEALGMCEQVEAVARSIRGELAALANLERL